MRLTLATFALVRKTIPPNDEKLRSELGLNQRPTAQRAACSTTELSELFVEELVNLIHIPVGTVFHHCVTSKLRPACVNTEV